MDSGSYRSRASSIGPSRSQSYSYQKNNRRPILTAKSSDSAPSDVEDVEVGESASNVPDQQQQPRRNTGLPTDVKISGKGIASAGGFKYFYDCSCSVCKRFWRETFGDAATELLTLSVQERKALISPILRLGDQYVKCGDRVKVWGRFQGIQIMTLIFTNIFKGVEFIFIQYFVLLILVFIYRSDQIHWSIGRQTYRP